MEKMIYNYRDADGYERADMGKDEMGNKRPNAKRIYRLLGIDEHNKTTRLESRGAWGDIYIDVFPIHTVEPIKTKSDK